ncbi:MAG: class I adenylate cyclase, partial [Proteobacteria bacterium]|nr:class I adenylate cyclase [Pseudomonadota bacterium]
EKKVEFLKGIGHLPPQTAILPVLAGITSYHLSVRNIARHSFEHIQEKIKTLLSDPFDAARYSEGMKASHSVCTRIYTEIKPNMTLKELSSFFKMLLEVEGKGAHFAFMAVYRGLIAVSAMEKIILTLPEIERLDFVDQYLQISPAIRLKLGIPFVRFLRSIKNRKTVIEFYASLFDRQRDADPFLKNIAPELHRKELILENEIASSFPEEQLMGLKALSMITSRIDADVLTDFLMDQKVKKIRMVIYTIVENSSMGTYQKLFTPILNLFASLDEQEAFFAFKALVVSGKKPIYTILEMVQKEYPLLMPLIQEELSSLSRLSFFVLQDIALNKDKYRTSNFEVNLSCVFGMVKKRPERVVRILKKYEFDPKDSVRMDVTRFIEKTKQLLIEEKQDIETQFDSVVEQVMAAGKTSRGLIKRMFSTPAEKKLEALKAGHAGGSIDFEEQLVANADVSSGTFHSPQVYFSRSIIHNCDFSHASFLHTYFKKAVFYNVDMQHARFDTVSFDFAVFINVDAKNAEFKNCSFQEVSFFNCNLNQARITDASFFNSTISKTSFSHTDLSFSSFAYSRISAVSFISSTINQTDFTGVKARFCRFPASAKNISRVDDIDYNARKYQLSYTDMPRMNQSIVNQINMLLFCEFIHYGEKKFLKQNQLSLLTAFDIFKPRQADLFQIIPFLLHENVMFPGIETVNPKTPCGICDYIPDIETQAILKKYISQKDIVARRNNEYAVEGLFTIGSVGSIAQTADSDIDYWVCYDEEKISVEGVKLLQDKLEKMEQMVADQFDLQVTFFLVDIHHAKANDFGDSSLESSGSAQARLLKEEFYRTMIHVAGKIPLWAVLPTPISLNYYNDIVDSVSAFPNLARYIDLGDIHAISSSEYFGASIWQMFKWLKSPFKSVIKMALLETYIYGYGKDSLLCNRYKDEWMNSGVQLRLAQNDSYFILLENLLKYYVSNQDTHSVHLLLTCFFLKLEISKDSQIDNTVFGFRKILLEKCMVKWGWKKEDVFKIGSFKSWYYSDIARLSAAIEKYMVKKYKTVNKAFESLLHGRSQISPEDRTVLGRKIYIEFSKQPGKVEKVLLVSRSDQHFEGLHLKYVQKEGNVGTWVLINKQAKAAQYKEEPLVKARTIEEIGAWLINNSLYNENAVINLVPNPTYVTFDDVRKLFKAMYDFLEPIHKSLISFDQLLMKSQPLCLFISINFYAPRQQNRVTEYTAIYLNSWGEMYCKSVYSKQGFASMDECKQDILKRVGIDKMPLNTAFYFSKGVAR